MAVKQRNEMDIQYTWDFTDIFESDEAWEIALNEADAMIDVFVGITTSGNAENIRLALIAARAAGVKSILLTGSKNGVCCEYADIVVAVPEKETFLIQELHLPIYHALCQAVEAALFNE